MTQHRPKGFTTPAYRQRVALVGRIRRGLRALTSGRINADTFDSLQARWTELERLTYARCYYQSDSAVAGIDARTVRMLAHIGSN